MNFRINPVGIESEYLFLLNLAFGNWGDASRLSWCFGGSSAQRAADIIVLESDGALVAGTGISYRHLVAPSGQSMLVGILTAAWTHPNKRERGLYLHVMREAGRLVAERGGALMLGFMPQDRLSGHQLLRAGSLAVSTAYLTTEGGRCTARGGALRRCVLTDDLQRELFRRVNLRAEQTLRFLYPSMEAFVLQFLERVNPVQILVDSEDNYFLVERSESVINLLAVLPSTPGLPTKEHLRTAVALAMHEQKELFAYASNGAAISTAASVGLVAKPGFLTATVADRAAFLAAVSGDPMASDAFIKTQCQEILCTIHLENGDRM